MNEQPTRDQEAATVQQLASTSDQEAATVQQLASTHDQGIAKVQEIATATPQGGRQHERGPEEAATEQQLARATPQVYDDFPLPIVLIRADIFLLWLASSVVLSWTLHLWALLGFVVLFVGVFGYTLGAICRRCDYYGHRCDSGLSLLATLLFRQRGPRSEYRSCAKRALLPLGLLFLTPLVFGVVLLVHGGASLYHGSLLSLNFAAIAAFALTTPKLACKHCKMAEICPLASR